MRRYELMLVLRPDTADDRVQQILDKTTRGIAASDGQIIKVSPWGRRRLAYPISGHNEGSYFIVVFDAPSEAIDDVERGLNITEEIMRYLVTRIERPANARRSERKVEDADDSKGAADTDGEAAVDGDDAESPAATIDDIALTPPPPDEEPESEGEVIDESEAEAAPKAIG
ncbi:MAG: 30S ribosomal protein S6 [Chloroflexota bacterium]